MLETPISTDPAELAAPSAADRTAALARWRREHAPSASETKLAEAARVSRILMTRDGPAFDPVSFAEFVEFIEELPF